MSTPPVSVERRVGQRFPYLLPISVRQPSASIEGVGFTQDVSSRGVFLLIDAALTEGSEVELTLEMPSEITLGESMPVRCKGHILRVVHPLVSSASSAETKIGVAVRLECYEYLPVASESPASFARISTLHPQHDDEQPRGHSAGRP